MWREAYCKSMAEPPKPVVGGANVASRAKVGYQLESLAMHYFHGSHVLPSSLVNPPTAFGQAVGRLLLADDAGPNLHERLEQCLQIKGAGGIGSAAAMNVLWRAYLRHLFVHSCQLLLQRH